jgi:integrase
MRTKIRRKQTRSGVRYFVASVEADGRERGHGGFKTQREAKARAAEILADAGRGRYVTPGRLTVGEYLLGEWLEARRSADISPGTLDVERTMVESWICPHIGTIPLQGLAARDLDRLYRTLREHGGRGGKPLRGKSIRNAHALLSKALGDAVRRGHILANPVSAVDPPKRDDSVERTAWTATEAQRFLEAAADDRLGAIWRLLLASGLRRGEVLGLTWDDVADGTVMVRRQVLVRSRSVGSATPRVYVRETTKGRRTRRIRIDDQTAAALRRWHAAQIEGRLAFGGAWHTDGGLGIEAPWIVTEPDGKILHPDTLLRRFVALVERAGVTPLTIHGARHTYATLSLASGVRLDVVSRALGHASIATTGNVYAHGSDEAEADAAERIGAMLEGGRHR